MAQPQTIPDPDLITKMECFTKKYYRDTYPSIDPTQPELSQAGKVVIVTGASRGIGKQGFAASFARAHAAAIVLIARSTSNLAQTEDLIKRINPHTKVLSFAVDILDEAGIQNAMQETVKRVGIPSVLVNNAAAMTMENIASSDSESWWKIQEVNVKGTYITTKAFLGVTGTNPTSPTTIINVTSQAATHVAAGLSSYSISKLASIKINSHLAEEYPSITCVALNPGFIATEVATNIPILVPFIRDTPELAGDTAVWLSSGDRKFLSGRVMTAWWDVDEMLARKQEIIEGNLLTPCLRGRFGI
ncbi:hypothetical protein MPDQ_003674 [Monascus purpureus]|uniref:NAD(P)-binding protein n=1 Tax=Monascus purpureus TaxID=5098 RepID=A0A507QYR8_MONPU|nr:hypothetical protein MPDQ_003674 [Monascus purpureus]BDD63037.1 hypothetical protein MAP00_007985 [Monascus purpureus]